MALKTIKLRIHNTLNSNHQFVFLFLLVGEGEGERDRSEYQIKNKIHYKHAQDKSCHY